MFYKDKNILVTGGTGFTGVNLINKLISLGANVYSTIHNKPPVLINEKIKYYKGDLTDKSFCEQICKGIDYVFVCAANTSGAAVMQNTPLVHVTPNVIMNSLLLESAHKEGVKKLLFISSSTVYPLSDEPLKESDVNYTFFNKYFCVGWMKRFSEILCEMYSTKIKNPMQCIIVRPGNLYGPYDDYEWETSHSTASLIRRVVERHNPLVVWGDGTDTKDLIFIDDYIDGLVLAMEKIEKFEIVNIAKGVAYSIKETLETILDIEGFTNVDILYDTSKPTMIPKREISTEKSVNMLGFSAKTSLEDGLRKTIQWYKGTIKNG